MLVGSRFSLFFFFNQTATTEISTLSLHDALPIYDREGAAGQLGGQSRPAGQYPAVEDRKSTRLNSSHPSNSYAVFCFKKKTQSEQPKNTNQKKKQMKENKEKNKYI